MRNANKKGYHSTILAEVLASITPEEQYLTDQRMLFAAYLYDCIKEAGYKTKSAFAKAIGQQPSVVTKWLSGTHNFTADTLWLIGRLLKKEFLPVVKIETANALTLVTVFKTTAQHLAEAKIAMQAETHVVHCRTLSTSVQSGTMLTQAITNNAGY